jgi:hypothetical protein
LADKTSTGGRGEGTTRRQANEPYVKNLGEANRRNRGGGTCGGMLQSRHARLEMPQWNQEIAGICRICRRQTTFAPRRLDPKGR